MNKVDNLTIIVRDNRWAPLQNAYCNGLSALLKKKPLLEFRRGDINLLGLLRNSII